MVIAVTVAHVAIAVAVTVATVVVAIVVTAAIAVTVLPVLSRKLALKASTPKARLSNNSNSDVSHEEAGCW